MGLFKSMKQMKDLTKQAKQLQEQQQAEQGYKSGMAGQFQQMGDMLEQANQQLGELTGRSGDRQRILAEGIPGTATIVGMGTPIRGAQQFNLDLDLEVHVSGRAPYRVANEYIVPAAAPLGQGVTLPVKVDPDDQAKIAIDWDNVASGPARGEVRPAGAAAGSPPAPSAPAPAIPSGGSDDKVAELERLARLKESGALTEAEFEQQKARILGG